MTTLRMAWRNIWRQPRRTLMTAAAVALGLAGMIVWLGLIEGMNDHLLKAATEGWVGDGQIHAEGFRESQDLETLIEDTGLLPRVKASKDVDAAAPRLFADALVAIGDRSSGVRAVGTDLAAEAQVTGWKERLSAGEWPTSDEHCLIGVKLAERLEVRPGDRLVLTLSVPDTGDLASRLLRVTGLLATQNSFIDGQTLILGLGPLRDAMEKPEGLHQVALRMRRTDGDEGAAQRSLASLRAPGLDVAGWRKLNPSLASLMDLQMDYLIGTTFVVFFIIALGILNTLSMSVLERTQEFGVLGALGASPFHVFGLIVTEAFCLGLVGGLIGLGVGLLFNWPLSVFGLQLTSTEIAGVRFDRAIRSDLSAVGALALTGTFVVLTTLTSLWTALRAARIRPVEALRAR